MLTSLWTVVARRAPVQHLELHGAAAVELVDLGREGHVEPAHRERTPACIPPDGFMRGIAVRQPKLDVLLVRTHALERTLLAEVSRQELHTGIPLPRRPQPVQLGQRSQRDFVQPDLGIESKWGLQILRLERTAGEFVQALAEQVELSGWMVRPAAMA